MIISVADSGDGRIVFARVERALAVGLERRGGCELTEVDNYFRVGITQRLWEDYSNHIGITVQCLVKTTCPEGTKGALDRFLAP